MSKRKPLTEVLGREPEATARKRGRPPGKSSQLETGEYRQMKVLIAAAMHRRVKHAAIDHDKEMSEIVAEALELWLERHT